MKLNKYIDHTLLKQDATEIKLIVCCLRLESMICQRLRQSDLG